MTQEQRLEHIENDIDEIKKTIGSLHAKYDSLFNVFSGNDPVRGKQKSYAERLAAVEKNQTYLKVMLIGIGIGVVIGGLLFGVLTLKQVTDAIKTIK